MNSWSAWFLRSSRWRTCSRREAAAALMSRPVLRNTNPIRSSATAAPHAPGAELRPYHLTGARLRDLFAFVFFGFVDAAAHGAGPTFKSACKQQSRVRMQEQIIAHIDTVAGIILHHDRECWGLRRHRSSQIECRTLGGHAHSIGTGGARSMKRNLLACAVICAVMSTTITGSVLAADLPPVTRAPILVPPPDPWSGFYVGIHGGWGFGDVDFRNIIIGE